MDVIKYSIVLIFLSLFVQIGLSEAFGLEALERVPIESPRLVNAFGNPVFEHVNVNQQVQVSADITNKQEVIQSFIFILQIKDEAGAIRSLNWITGVINPGQSFSPALSWIPDEPGTFTARVFLWEDMNEADALSPPAEIIITAS